MSTHLSNVQNVWLRQGIAHWKGFGDFDLTPEFRTWIKENIKSPWYWDHFWDEMEVEIVFADSKEAMLFKLTWL